MAAGDKDNIVSRLWQGLPKQWFQTDNPAILAVLDALATAWAWVYSLYAYIALQSRIKTASDGFLDLIAADFFGNSLIRKAGQSDASFLALIIANLFRERGTREAVIQVLTELTGRAPVIIEPLRPADTGAYSVPTSGYGVAGAYGSMVLPYQAFIKAFRHASSGIPNIAGYGNPSAAYGVPSQGGEYASMSMIQGSVTDADIFAAVDSVAPVGTILWTSISS